MPPLSVNTIWWIPISRVINKTPYDRKQGPGRTAPALNPSISPTTHTHILATPACYPSTHRAPLWAISIILSSAWNKFPQMSSWHTYFLLSSAQMLHYQDSLSECPSANVFCNIATPSIPPFQSPLLCSIFPSMWFIGVWYTEPYIISSFR